MTWKKFGDARPHVGALIWVRSTEVEIDIEPNLPVQYFGVTELGDVVKGGFLVKLAKIFGNLAPDFWPSFLEWAECLPPGKSLPISPDLKRAFDAFEASAKNGLPWDALFAQLSDEEKIRFVNLWNSPIFDADKETPK